MDRAEMKLIAEETAIQAVNRTLTGLGIDIHNPLEAQKDMAVLREVRNLIDDEDFHKDMLHLRRWRVTMESVESKGVLAAIGLVCLGGAGLILYAFKIKFAF